MAVGVLSIILLLRLLTLVLITFTFLFATIAIFGLYGVLQTKALADGTHLVLELSNLIEQLLVSILRTDAFFFLLSLRSDIQHLVPA